MRALIRLAVLVLTLCIAGIAQAQTYSEAQLREMFKSDGHASQTALDYILQHPDAVPPMFFAGVSSRLWARGDRSQATFWFYLYQGRTLPWVKVLGPNNIDSFIRRGINTVEGKKINEWIGSDFEAWREVGARAIAFEKTAPLYPGRPDGIAEPDWNKLVAEQRADYEASFLTLFGHLTAESVAAGRRSAGLYVGPLQSPGKPLPEAWR